MTSPDLPAELKAALDAKLRGFSRNDAAERSASISKNYRDGGGSGTIRTETDALAYALARMPATYAAITASLNAFCEIRPDFAPQRKRSQRCKTSRCSTPTTRYASWRSTLSARVFACAKSITSGARPAMP
jgi:hypothetical protein